MRRRCHSPGATGYRNYGARGIEVCRAWDSFEQFVRDVALLPGYLEGAQLDRINNDGNYEPGNVRWATCTQQAHNRRLRPSNKSGTSNLSYRPHYRGWGVYVTIAGDHYHRNFYEDEHAARQYLAELESVREQLLLIQGDLYE